MKRKIARRFKTRKLARCWSLNQMDGWTDGLDDAAGASSSQEGYHLPYRTYRVPGTYLVLVHYERRKSTIDFFGNRRK